MTEGARRWPPAIDDDALCLFAHALGRSPVDVEFLALLRRVRVQTADCIEQRRTAELIDLLGFGTAYPLTEVLRILADAADHLLNDHACDSHGYEVVGAARDSARQLLARLQVLVQ